MRRTNWCFAGLAVFAGACNGQLITASAPIMLAMGVLILSFLEHIITRSHTEADASDWEYAALGLALLAVLPLSAYGVATIPRGDLLHVLALTAVICTPTFVTYAVVVYLAWLRMQERSSFTWPLLVVLAFWIAPAPLYWSFDGDQGVSSTSVILFWTGPGFWIAYALAAIGADDSEPATYAALVFSYMLPVAICSGVAWRFGYGPQHALVDLGRLVRRRVESPAQAVQYILFAVLLGAFTNFVYDAWNRNADIEMPVLPQP